MAEIKKLISDANIDTVRAVLATPTSHDVYSGSDNCRAGLASRALGGDCGDWF